MERRRTCAPAAGRLRVLNSVRQRLIKLNEHAAGDVTMPEAELRKKLGLAAWHVWQVLCDNRNRDGFTHITRLGIGRAYGFATTKDTVVKDALVRLQQAGLMQPVGWRKAVVPRGSKLIERKVYFRRVLGSRLLVTSPNAEDQVQVPAAVHAWCNKATGWGGKRWDGKTPPSSQHTAPIVSNTPLIAPTLEIPMDEERGRPQAPESSTPIIGQVPPTSGAPKGVKYPHRCKVLSTTGRMEASPPKGEEDCAAPSAAAGPSFSSTPDGDVLAGGAFRAGPNLSAHGQGVPIYPGNTVVAPAYVPAAPMLNPESPEHELAAKLAASYRGAVEKRFPKQRCFTLLKGDIRKSKHYKLLVAFAAELIEHEISPAAWCIFSVDKWRTAPSASLASRPKVPGIAYVFSLARISDDKRWQFRAAYNDGKLGGRAVFGKSHRQLLERYQKMHHAILRGLHKATAMQQFFPGTLYEDLVDAARAEAAETRFRLEGQVARGAFVW